MSTEKANVNCLGQDQTYIVIIILIIPARGSRDSPSGPVAKTLHSRGREPGFDPCSGN